MRVSHLSAALLVALGLTWSSATLAAETRIPESVVKDATALRDRALQDNTSWKIVESLTSEVGPRLAGSEGDARAATAAATVASGPQISTLARARVTAV